MGCLGVVQWSHQKQVTSQAACLSRIIKNTERESHPITLNYCKLSLPQCSSDSEGRKSKVRRGGGAAIRSFMCVWILMLLQ